jgi:hypothetical protein
MEDVKNASLGKSRQGLRNCANLSVLIFERAREAAPAALVLCFYVRLTLTLNFARTALIYFGASCASIDKLSYFYVPFAT